MLKNAYEIEQSGAIWTLSIRIMFSVGLFLDNLTLSGRVTADTFVYVALNVNVGSITCT